MRTKNSVFGKFLVSAMLVLGLTAASCNQRSSEVKVKEDKEGNEEIRIKERQNTDSVDVRRDQSIKMDEDGDRSVKDNTKVDVDENSGQGGMEGTTNDRDVNRSGSSTNRGTNQGNDTSGDNASRRR